MSKDRSKTENNVIDFNQAKQKLENIKSTIHRLSELEKFEKSFYPDLIKKHKRIKRYTDTYTTTTTTTTSKYSI